MSTQANNHQLLIHYFQDSLTVAALKWYMGLDSANIRTFNDLGEAFIQQYKYNLYLAFRGYAQRWRELAAQISPPLEEKEMTKIFLNILNQFYYEKMIASAPSDFSKIVNMGIRLEEGVLEGRLVKESVPINSSKKKDQEVSMVNGRPQQQYSAYHLVVAVMPVTNAIQNPGYQLQLPQRSQQQQQPRQQAPSTRFDLIPIRYAEFLQCCLKRTWSRPRRLLPCRKNCHLCLESISHVSSMKGHQVMMLSIVTLWKMQFKI